MEEGNTGGKIVAALQRIEQGLAVLGEHLYQCDGKADRRIANLVEDVAVVGNPKIVADEDLVHGV